MKRVVALLLIALSLISTAGATETRSHMHEWDYLTRSCVICGQTHPCWSKDEKTFVHDFSGGDVCPVCGIQRYCGNPDHAEAAKAHPGHHALASCGLPGHYLCDNLYHGAFSCHDGHTACMGEQKHFCEHCRGYYPCSYARGHEFTCAACGRWWCDRSSGAHEKTACGHRGCVVSANPAAHALLPCGHTACRPVEGCCR